MATQTHITKVQTGELEKGLDKLRSDAVALKVIRTTQEYEQAGGLLTAIRNYKKDVKNKLNPFVDIARRAYEEARQEMNKYLNGAEQLDMMVSNPMAEFKRLEREAAAAEERRINEERRRQAEAEALERRKQEEAAAAERRKQDEKEIADARKAGELKAREAEKLRKEALERERLAREQAARDAEAAKNNVQDVKVLPNVPKIAGTRARVNWKFRLVDANKIPRAFLVPDDVLIGRMVRDVKDKVKAEAQCPGIEVYTEDSI